MRLLDPKPRARACLMLVFMAAGALLGLCFKRYQHGPQTICLSRLTLIVNPELLTDVDSSREWREKQSDPLEPLMETLCSPEMRRKTCEKLKKSYPDAITERVHVSAELGPIPNSIILTIRTTLPFHAKFGRTLIEEYIAFRKSIESNAGMPASITGDSLRLVEDSGSTVWERPAIDPLGPLIGSILGFICFVLFQWFRGDY